jgi:DNA-binding response OmpR family regulator
MMSKISNHILVVDDDDKIRDLLKDFLIKNNFLVTTGY